MNLKLVPDPVFLGVYKLLRDKTVIGVLHNSDFRGDSCREISFTVARLSFEELNQVAKFLNEYTDWPKDDQLDTPLPITYTMATEKTS